jgi:hypothetical protein
MMVWTDIWYDKAEGVNGQPTPGMSYIEEELEKDLVDLPAISSYLAGRCAELRQDNKGSSLSEPNLGLISDERFWLDDSARQANGEQPDPMLLPTERVQMGALKGRSGLVLTTHRAIKIDTQGWAGKQISYLSVPYASIRAYSVDVESEGGSDAAAELKLHFKSPWFNDMQDGCIVQDLRKTGADIVAIQKFLSAQVLGKCDGACAATASSAPERVPSGVGSFANWLSGSASQVDEITLAKKLRKEPKILLPDETVDLAFKSGRDFAIYTTRRVLFMKMQGWTGNRVQYLSVPYAWVPCFAITSPGGPLALGTMRLYTDSPATDSVSIDMCQGQCDFKAAYQVLVKKCGLERLAQSGGGRSVAA